MNRKTYLLAALLTAATLTGMLSCIDNNYRIDEIDKEVHFAPGGASFPLGYIRKTELGKIFGDDLKMIAEHEDGYYVLRHEGAIGYTIGKIDINEITFDNLAGFFGEAIRVNPKGDGNQLPETIPISRQSFDIDHNTPSFDMSGETSIELLNLNGTGVIPVSGEVGENETFSGTIGSGSNAKIEIDVTLPTQVNSVQTVWFKDENDTPSSEKATVKITLNPGGLAPVTKSIKIDEFNVTLPANYKIEPGDYSASVSPNGNAFQATNINPGSGPYELEFYITEIDMSGIVPNEGNLYQEEDFSYTIKYTVTTSGGTAGTAPPTSTITGAPAFRDALFTTNEIEFEVDTYTYDYSQTFSVDDAVESVSYVAFAAGGNTISLSMADPGLPDSFQDELPIVIKFPASFDIEPVAGYDAGKKTLTVKASQLVNGYDLKLKGIGFTGTAATPNGGKLTVAGAIEVSAKHEFDETTFLWSEDIAPKTIPEKIKFEIGPDDLAIDYANSIYTASQKVEASGKFDESFQLPAVLKGVSQVLVAKAAQGTAAVEMTLSVDVSSWVIDEFYLDDFKIQLPSFLMIDPGVMGDDFDTETNIYSPGRITIKNPSTGSNRIVLASFNVNGLKGIAIDDGEAVLRGDMSFSATARTPEGADFDPDDNLTITPNLEISDIIVTGLDGMLDLEDYIDNDDIDPIDFSELFEYLSDNEIQQPNLAAPVLTLDIINPLGIEVLGDIALTPKNADGDPLCNPIMFGQDNRFKIEPSGNTLVYITDNGADNCPGGYTGYSLELSNLVDVIPHMVDIDLSGTVNPNKNLISSLLLGDDDNAFSLAYTIEIPLSFGPDMDMKLEFDVDDLNKTFSKLAEQKVKAADIVVYAGFTVTFPLVIDDVEVTFTDNQGDPIEGLQTTVSGSITGPANAGDEAQESVLSVRIIVPNGGDFTRLSQIDIMKITIPISPADRSKNAQNQLRPDDTIEGRVWIELAKGVSVNLGDLE